MRTALLVALVACSPEIPEGLLVCGPSDPCPPGFFCRSSGRCYRTPSDDASVRLDSSVRVDGGPPIACESDAQCEDGDPCTLNECTDRVCETMPAGVGDSCGDGAARCCGGRCIQANTGAACGAACEVCEANEICVDGNRCECAGGFGDCDAGVPGCETNLNTDALHCGSCPEACSGTKSCISGMCSTCMMDLDCDDGSVCTRDRCMTGACVRKPVAGSCDDGNRCTSMDSCVAGSCVGSVRMCPDDGNVCTSDTCNPDDGTCSTLPVVAVCTDFDDCTMGDICMGTSCAGTPYACSDSTDPPLNCSAPSCDGFGGCTEFPLPNGTQCQNLLGGRYVCQDGGCVDLNSVCCSPGATSGACCSASPDPRDFAACDAAGRCVPACC